MWYIIMYNAWYFLHCFHISALMPSIPMLFSPFCNIARITSSLLCQLNICLVEVIIAIRGKIINFNFAFAEFTKIRFSVYKFYSLYPEIVKYFLPCLSFRILFLRNIITIRTPFRITTFSGPFTIINGISSIEKISEIVSGGKEFDSIKPEDYALFSKNKESWKEFFGKNFEQEIPGEDLVSSRL